MNRDPLERRRDPRTPACQPIMLRTEGSIDVTPAHLIDLSTCGAALLTTACNAPILGEHLELEIETRGNNENGDPAEVRRESGIVVNIGTPERGVSRLGIRFIARNQFAAEMREPLDLLSDHRGGLPDTLVSDRWGTARNFDLFRKSRDKETAGTV